MRFFVIFCLLVSKFFFGQEATDTLQLNPKSFLYDLDKLPPEFFADRRKMLRTMMPDKSVAFILANPIRNRSNDVNFEYHQDPNMYYLSGFEEPHSLLVIFKEDVLVNSLPTNEILFVQKRNPDEEVWDGKRLGVDGGESVLKVKMAMNASEFKDLELNLENFESIHVLNAKNDVNDNPFKKDDLFNLMQQLYAKVPVEKEDEIDDKNIASWLSMMREIKTPEELLLMRRAIEITCEAQIELMKYLEPEMKEYQAEAVIEYVFKKNGAEYPGFPSILGSGENSCILHYTTNRKTMKGNNLLVSDVGAEYHGYTADVTRTIPLDGSFSKEERIIYQIVYDAQNEYPNTEIILNPIDYQQGMTSTDCYVKACLNLEDLGIKFEEGDYIFPYERDVFHHENSNSEIKFYKDVKTTYTKISYVVYNTVIREHLNKESGHFTMGGKHYTFVRLKMPKEVFDALISEAKASNQ